MSESDFPAALPPEVIEAFTTATITALQELTQIEAFAEQPPQIAAASSASVVAATIRLMRATPGTFSLVLAAETATALAARYLPAGTSLTEEMIDDVAGEFANVIAGQAKTSLKGTSYHFTMSTPVVVRTASLTQLSGDANASPVAALECELGRVLLFVDLSSCPNA